MYISSLSPTVLHCARAPRISASAISPPAAGGGKCGGPGRVTNTGNNVSRRWRGGGLEPSVSRR
jgi:hypothetical protein